MAIDCMVHMSELKQITEVNIVTSVHRFLFLLGPSTLELEKVSTNGEYHGSIYLSYLIKEKSSMDHEYNIIYIIYI